MRRSSAFLVVVSGPSGAGKTTICDALIERDPLLRDSISTTTRPVREGEVDGEHYFFVDEAKFEALKDGELLEWAEVHGHHYGTPRAFVEGEMAAGHDVVLNIDVQGGIQVKKAFPEAVMVFILPPSFEQLESRMRQRGTDAGDEVAKRMANARAEVEAASEYAYIVINDDLDPAIDAVHDIIRAERCRRGRYPADFIDQYGGDDK